MTISERPGAVDDAPPSHPDRSPTPGEPGAEAIAGESAVPSGGEGAPDEDDAQRALRARIARWNDCGATSVPALLVALGSAVGGALTLFLRRRRRG